MITLHHLEGSRSHRILWLLEELGLDYDLRLYHRDPQTRLAPPELKAVHPLGKAPVLSDGDAVIAESGAIIEYLAETYGRRASGDLAGLLPLPGEPAYRPCRFWMHYAEGSLMNWLVMKLVFASIPRAPMPFFVRPIARALCQAVRERLIDPNVRAAAAFMESELATRPWFAGDALCMADFQMGFAVEALLADPAVAAQSPRLLAYRERLRQRPAYQRAIAKGGPVLIGN